MEIKSIIAAYYIMCSVVFAAEQSERLGDAKAVILCIILPALSLLAVIIIDEYFKDNIK